MTIFIDASKGEPTSSQPAIIQLSTILQEDGKRVKVKVVIQDLTGHPDLELVLEDAQGKELARSMLMEIIANTAEFTLHIRDLSPQPPFRVSASIMLKDEQVISTLSSPVT